MTTRCQDILEQVKAHANPANVEGMARFGINPNNTYGVPVPVLRSMAKDIGKDHALALELWSSGVHEARVLAGFVDDPKQVTEKQMQAWVAEFDSWDVCDQVCSNLFDRTPLAYDKAFEWSGREHEFVKRAGFVLMAALTVHDKQATDDTMARFLPVIQRESADARNFVKKAVNWALRQIGKRNRSLNRMAIRTAKQIQKMDSPVARWVAADALKELTADSTQARLTHGNQNHTSRTGRKAGAKPRRVV